MSDLGQLHDASTRTVFGESSSAIDGVVVLQLSIGCQSKAGKGLEKRARRHAVHGCGLNLVSLSSQGQHWRGVRQSTVSRPSRYLSTTVSLKGGVVATGSDHGVTSQSTRCVTVTSRDNLSPSPLRVYKGSHLYLFFQKVGAAIATIVFNTRL